MAKEPLIVCRQGAALFAATPGTSQAIQKIPHGQLAVITIRRPRSVQWHRRYWVLVGMIAENSSYTAEEIHVLIKLRTGLVKEIREKDGHVWRIPDSTAFEIMDGTQWSTYWDRVVDVVLRDFLPISPEQLKQELAALCGVHPETIGGQVP